MKVITTLGGVVLACCAGTAMGTDSLNVSVTGPTTYYQLRGIGAGGLHGLIESQVTRRMIMRLWDFP